MDREVLMSYLLSSLSQAGLPGNLEEEPRDLALRLKNESPPQWRRFLSDYNIRVDFATGRFYDLYESRDSSSWDSTGLEDELP